MKNEKKAMIFLMDGPYVLMEYANLNDPLSRLQPIIAPLPEGKAPVLAAFDIIESATGIKLNVVDGVTDIGALRLPVIPYEDDCGDVVHVFAAKVDFLDVKHLNAPVAWAHSTDVARARPGNPLFETKYAIPYFAYTAASVLCGEYTGLDEHYFPLEPRMVYTKYNKETRRLEARVCLPTRIVNRLNAADVSMDMAVIMSETQLMALPGIGATSARTIADTCEKLVQYGFLENLANKDKPKADEVSIGGKPVKLGYLED